jgi:hypothetical protein
MPSKHAFQHKSKNVTEDRRLNRFVSTLVDLPLFRVGDHALAGGIDHVGEDAGDGGFRRATNPDAICDATRMKNAPEMGA